MDSASPPDLMIAPLPPLLVMEQRQHRAAPGIHRAAARNAAGEWCAFASVVLARGGDGRDLVVTVAITVPMGPFRPNHRATFAECVAKGGYLLHGPFFFYRR
jgi:hypothetical protein